MFNKALEADALFRTLITTAVDGIIVIDGRGTIQIYGAACERLFGYSAAEVIGKNVKILMPSPYREEHDDYLHNYQGTGVKRIIGIGREVIGQRKDGSTFPMYLSVGEGRLEAEIMYVGIIHDLTSRNVTTRRMQDLQNELLHVSRLSAMGQMTAALARIVVSAVDQTWVARILAKDYINRRLVIYKATLDAAWNVVVDPAVVFDGLMKKPQILDDPDAADCKLMISASHDASDVNNAAGRRTNDQSQQVYFPGDRIFRYASQSDRSILWGGGVAP